MITIDCFFLAESIETPHVAQSFDGKRFVLKIPRLFMIMFA